MKGDQKQLHYRPEGLGYNKHQALFIRIRDGQNDYFPGTSSFSSVHYNDSFV